MAMTLCKCPYGDDFARKCRFHPNSTPCKARANRAIGALLWQTIELGAGWISQRLACQDSQTSGIPPLIKNPHGTSTMFRGQ